FLAQTQVRSAHVIGTCLNGQQTSDLRDIVQWSVADPTIASVGNTDNDRAQVTGLKAGTTTPTATEPITGFVSRQVNNLVVRGSIVDVVMSPTSGKVPLGQVVPFKARAKYSDGSDSNVSEQCDWSILNPSVASVDNVSPGKGGVTGIVL